MILFITHKTSTKTDLRSSEDARTISAFWNAGWNSQGNRPKITTISSSTQLSYSSLKKHPIPQKKKKKKKRRSILGVGTGWRTQEETNIAWEGSKFSLCCPTKYCISCLGYWIRSRKARASSMGTHALVQSIEEGRNGSGFESLATNLQMT